MLLSYLFEGDIQGFLVEFLLRVPVILIALTFHEVAHGYVSYKLGDPTAYNQGRLSLNPLKHLDLVGSISMLIFSVGWAKPVPVNSRYYKNPKWGMALTALAGPVTNLILGFIGILLGRLVTLAAMFIPMSYHLYEVLQMVFWSFATLNVSLAVFNLLPIPPFDGSRIAFVFLPTRLYFGVMRYEHIIRIVLLVVLASGFLDLPLYYITNYILKGMLFLTGVNF